MYQYPYTPYAPMQYPAAQVPSATPQQQTISNNGINWVQGESGAKAYLLAPNQSAMLLDSEADVFYIKSSDASGMPLPLRIFDYKERTQAAAPTVSMEQYVTRDELERRLTALSKGGVTDGE